MKDADSKFFRVASLRFLPLVVAGFAVLLLLVTVAILLGGIWRDRASAETVVPAVSAGGRVKGPAGRIEASQRRSIERRETDRGTGERVMVLDGDGAPSR